MKPAVDRTVEEAAAGVARSTSKQSNNANACRSVKTAVSLLLKRPRGLQIDQDLGEEAVRVLQRAREAKVQAQAHSGLPR